MQWWAWIVVGAILLAAELTVVDAQFYLVFVGLAALIVGCLEFLGLALAPWLQWAAFAVLAAVSMLAFRRRIYGRLRRDLPVMGQGPAGETLTLVHALPSGMSCRVEFRGTSWSAQNQGPVGIAAGARARIERIEGLTLILRAE